MAACLLVVADVFRCCFCMYICLHSRCRLTEIDDNDDESQKEKQEHTLYYYYYN